MKERKICFQDMKTVRFRGHLGVNIFRNNY